MPSALLSSTHLHNIRGERRVCHLHHPSDALPQPPSSEDQTPGSFQPNYSHTQILGAETEPLPRTRCSPGAAPHKRGRALHRTWQGRWSTSCLAQTASTTGRGGSPTPDTGHGNYLHRVKWLYLDNDNQQKRNHSELERHYKGEN